VEEPLNTKSQQLRRTLIDDVEAGALTLVGLNFERSEDAGIDQSVLEQADP
jgi:hypothetical protein